MRGQSFCGQIFSFFSEHNFHKKIRPLAFPKNHGERKRSAVGIKKKNPLKTQVFKGMCDRYTIDEHITVADFCNLFFRLVFTRNLIGRFNQICHDLIELRGVF